MPLKKNPRSPTSRTGLPLSAPLGVLLLCAVGVAFLGGQAMKAWRAQDAWVRGEGQVVETQVVQSRYSRAHPVTLFVRYRFPVPGGEARGSDVVDCPAGREACEAFAAEHFPAGKPVEVWHDPADPEQSALTLSPPALAWVVLALVLTGLVAAARMGAGALAGRSVRAATLGVFLDPVLAGGSGAVLAGVLANALLPAVASFAVIACLGAGLAWGAVRVGRLG